MSQSNQPTQHQSTNHLEDVNEKIILTLADFFGWDDISGPVCNLNFLLNEFITSDSFRQYEKEQIHDVVFKTTFTIDIIARLYELFERREKIVIEKYLSEKVYNSKRE